MVARLKRIGLPRLIVHASVLFIVLLWLLPTIGIFVSALRDKNQLAVSGWWTSFSTATQTEAVRLGGPETQSQEGSSFVISGNVFEGGTAKTITAFGTKVQEPAAFKVGEPADIGNGETLLVNADGSYRYTGETAFEGSRGKRIYLTASTPPQFSFDNYRTVLNAEGLGRSLII